MERISNVRSIENVIRFVFQPGNVTRFDVLLLRIPQSPQHLLVLENFTQKSMHVVPGQRYHINEIGEKLGFSNDSDTTELQDLILNDLEGML